MKTEIFNLCYRRLVRLLLPTFLRKELTVGLLESLCEPVRNLFEKNYKLIADRDTEGSNYRDYNLCRAGVTSSTCRLEYMANFHLNREKMYSESVEERIRIEEMDGYELLYLYLGGHIPTLSYDENGNLQSGSVQDEERPLILCTTAEANPLALHTQAETGETISDFRVIVPASLVDIDNKDSRYFLLDGLIKSYMLPDKKFEIVQG
ncbi:MAG: hypothetical protein LUG18_15245 [Candidatus Azobacteroides sp.]|nr:hypothetical protein [Candidatus Azobacteroides sp.]